MNIPRIAKAMEYVDDALISGALDSAPGEKEKHHAWVGEGASDSVPGEKKKHHAWVGWSAAAACLLLVLAGALIWKQSGPPAAGNDGITVSENAEGNGGMTASENAEGNGGITVSENGVTIPQMDISLSSPPAGAEADMLAFFIYQGRCYVQYEWIYDNDGIVGEYLGTATGLIDEWTPKEGYVELAGSISGDFYAVQGYDPSFLLCMKARQGVVSAYICNTGITLKYGSELYEDRLHLSENLTAVQYESRVSWYLSRGERYQMNSVSTAVLDFIEEMDGAEFMPSDSIPLKEGQDSIADTELYHLYFQTENGMPIHLRLHENGYVRFDGLMDLCVQVPEESYQALVNLLDNHTDAVAVETEITGTTFEDCLANAEFGAYVPTYVPEDIFFDFAEIYDYPYSQASSGTGTKEMWLYYMSLEDQDYYYSITITWADEYGENGWAGPMIDVADLSVEAISEYVEPAEAEGKPGSLDVGVWYGDVAVVLSGRGVSAETAFEILDSVQ